jgi:DNA polymerase III delta prime subunit
MHIDSETIADNEGFAATDLDEDLNGDRRKRRKTQSPTAVIASTNPTPPVTESSDWHQQLQVEVGGPIAGDTAMDSMGNEGLALLRASTPSRQTVEITALPNPPENEATKVTPKKQIKITKTGKLVSSPPKPVQEASNSPKKRRGRKPAKAKVSPTVTVIKYGSDTATRLAIGNKIEVVLNGKQTRTRRTVVPKQKPANPADPSKGTHPFFLGKADPIKDETPAQLSTAQLPPTPRTSAVTPGKLRAQARREREPGPVPSFGMASGSSRVTKQLGLYEPVWPTRDSAHVRSLDEELTQQCQASTTSRLVLQPRKAKNRVVTLSDTEDVISRLAKGLVRHTPTDNKHSHFAFAPLEDVRLPARLLTTGVEIQQKVHAQMRAQLPWSSEQAKQGQTIHPAMATSFFDIEHTLTPFDEGRCETHAWAHKYSPKCAAQVLQVGKEAGVLKDWLQSLTVMAVGGTQGSLTSESANITKPPKKKRKKDFNDFIVFDDEEEDEEMIEVSDTEYTHAQQARSFQRPHWTRNKNVIVISGPHGCGKSATVYAVAKELDFEVFEINSSTRRSGRDIQDKVGDMTANHLVNHKQRAVPAKEEVVPARETDDERMDTAFQKDVDSGRQGTMTSFFKAEPAAKPAAIPKPKIKINAQEVNEVTVPVAQALLPIPQASRSSQKQSLILFEEADILFDEDQQFWVQVAKLAAQSKRPIVITCNDEQQVPMQDLPLAAILRLRPVPVHLATDYMLLIAGREGHILKRQAVSDLYASKNNDLRASITELSFWCQMSVGDRKGGLEWMYQRWPPGQDIDKHGCLLRVASEGTYQSGMGWFSHNVNKTEDNAAFDKEEELLKEVWADWGISPGDYDKTSATADSSSHDQMEVLRRLDEYTESLSAADVYCRIGLPSYYHDSDQPTDPSLPPITEKARLNYTIAAPLLQVDHQIDFLSLDTDLYIQTHLLIKRSFPDLPRGSPSCTNTGAETEKDYTKDILMQKEAQSKKISLSRHEFSTAFDILAAPPDHTLFGGTSFNLTPSSFDRNFSIITTDLAPYVRSIVAHEEILEEQRVRLSSLLSGGGNGKRARTTRASRVALEGGVRETKRRDRWFDKNLNFELVMATAGKDWAGMGWKGYVDEGEEGTGSVTGTQESNLDVAMRDSVEDE